MSNDNKCVKCGKGNCGLVVNGLGNVCSSCYELLRKTKNTPGDKMSAKGGIFYG